MKKLAEPVFTDQEAMVEEVVFLANQTGQPHAVVYAGRGQPRAWCALPAASLGRRQALAICEPEEAHA